MQPESTVESMTVYANQSSYISAPTEAQKAAGTVPLDTLPADWWNRMWMDITTNMNNAGESLTSIYTELSSLLTAAGITPSSTSSSQVLAAVRKLARTLATSSVAGAVVSSDTSGKVSVDEQGVMTPNGMGTPSQLNTSSKVIVTALNEVLSTLNSFMTTTNSTLNNKAPVNHAADSTLYGQATGTLYGHVKLSDSVDSTCGNADGVAATPAAVKAAYDAALSIGASQVSISNTGENSSYPVALCTGAASLGRSTACALTFNPSTGILSTIGINTTGYSCFQCLGVTCMISGCVTCANAAACATNSTCLGGCTLAQVRTYIRNAGPYFANNTLYAVGDDVKIGDVNVGGMLGIQSATVCDPGIVFRNCAGTALGCLWVDLAGLCWNGTVKAPTFCGAFCGTACRAKAVVQCTCCAACVFECTCCLGSCQSCLRIHNCFSYPVLAFVQQCCGFPEYSSGMICNAVYIPAGGNTLVYCRSSPGSQARNKCFGVLYVPLL